MKAFKILTILFCFFINSPINLLSAVTLRPAEWLQSWLLCGPFSVGKNHQNYNESTHLPGFETDYLVSLGGEEKIKAEEGLQLDYQNSVFKWFLYSATDSIIDLDQAVSADDSVIAYAYTEIETNKEEVFVLAVGSNDGCRLWLNGEQILDYPGPRGIVPDDDLIPVALKKGKNSLLLKIEERGNRWGFCARFLRFNFDYYQKRKPIFEVKIKENKLPILVSCIPEDIAKKTFQKVNLQIFEKDNPNHIIWEKFWPFKKEIILPSENRYYTEYYLKINALLNNDEKWQSILPFSAGERIEYTLFNKGKTIYKININTEASDSEIWAAKELQYWLREISGADFTITETSDDQISEAIIIGYNQKIMEENGIFSGPPAALDEAFCYRNFGPTVVIWGGKQRGTMYGVMTFLEREFGCRWYTPTVTQIPKKEQFNFDYIFYKDSPKIQVRNDFYYEAFDPIWAARNKINGAMSYRDQPGGVQGYWAVHTFYQFMPPSEFFKEHPEYYSLIDGKRIHNRAQLCLTNPDVLKIVTDRVQKIIQNHPEHLIYSVSQNDWGNPCQCHLCQAITKKEGSESGPVVWFVNQVAESIESQFPDKYIGTLAYSYTRKAPKNIKPRNNVVIRLCSIECCFAHDFLICPENKAFLQDLQDWASLSPQLYIWDYVVNFSHYLLPYPNFGVLKSNLQTFRKNKAIGIMEQGAYQSRGGEFAELRAYLLAKLLWDPDRKPEPIIDDFMYGYYGRSGQYICQYFDFLHQQLTPETHIHLGLRPDDIIFSNQFILQSDIIFDEAEKVADNPEIKKRVEMARLPLMYLKLRRFPVKAKYDGTYQRFKKIVQREGITHYAEEGQSHLDAFHRGVKSAE